MLSYISLLLANSAITTSKYSLMSPRVSRGHVFLTHSSTIAVISSLHMFILAIYTFTITLTLETLRKQNRLPILRAAGTAAIPLDP